MAHFGRYYNGYGERIHNPAAYFRAVAEDRYGFNNPHGGESGDYHRGYIDGYSDGYEDGYNDGCSGTGWGDCSGWDD